ncbi:DUF2167 domain-containing protein [Sphingobacterium yanglingense]|uniref:Putative membrane-anchored protein n=1 Tax=Sphingobacterium yanglingense TaxID=1437280 RepID=A0A4R6WSY4_9SPHI|nr:DUF2167 domain-containing protein [Sphingobacterium yanglingense]TDQ82611.1 putative membrane-anchored protein [Sphingobacterium yanglingense]
MNKYLLTIFTLFIAMSGFAESPDSTEIAIKEIEQSLQYQTGTIKLKEGHGTLIVPKGFHFLDQEQSKYVLSDLWGNPEDNTIIGMLFPIHVGVLDDHSWGFTISYDPMGYVKDDDANTINYDDLLASNKKDILAENQERLNSGYGTIELIGWASTPYYDSNKKVLHWAKEIKFDGDSANTLNYNLRVLGREGIYLVNAVASMDELPEVNKNLDQLIASVQFDNGYKYEDYTDGDQIASWTVGGLVAGKILAKTGFFAAILKFWKIIAVGIAGGFSFLWKKIRGRNENDTIEAPTKPIQEENDEDSTKS